MRDTTEDYGAIHPIWDAVWRHVPDSDLAPAVEALDALAAENAALRRYARALESGIRRVSELSAQSGFPIVLHTRLIDDARRSAGVAEIMAREDR